ncbi:MAG: hypothetical protein JSW23_10030 [Planctomycetota bacterium]|nr:MAG: hypothetical protein JSW23_10030 [Planctomycetota bacterium]
MKSGLGRKGVVFVVFLMVCGAVYGKPWPGSGDANDPYRIHSAAQMQAIGADANYWVAHFRLLKDIDLDEYTGTSFNIIGTDYVNPFAGVFDGNGHTISNFTYDSNGVNYVGLFGYVSDVNAEIKGLGLTEPNIGAGTGSYVGCLIGRLVEGTVTDCYVEGGGVSGNFRVGGLIGSTYGGNISNCYSTSSVTGEGGSVGGLVGGTVLDSNISNSYSTGDVTGYRGVGGLAGSFEGNLQGCYSTGNVTGEGEVGGLAGTSSWGNIQGCYSLSSVTGSGYYVGGLVGYMKKDTSISNSYSTGTVSGGYEVGGLVGNIREGYIENCYSTGGVTGGGNFVGGLVGYNGGGYYGGVINCYWDTESSGIDTGYWGVGLTTADMHSKHTFFLWGCDGGWTIDDGNDYPRLAWEGKAGEVIDVGCGTEEEPYLVYGASSMYVIGGNQLIYEYNYKNYDKHYKLMADIDVGGYIWTGFNIIGNYNYPFEGVFDGNGHTISNFTCDSNGTDSVGLFGFIHDANAEVKNLGLIEPCINGGNGYCAGSLVGTLWSGTVRGCYVKAGSVTGNAFIGGLVGRNDWGLVAECYAESRVSGSSIVGGLVGQTSATVSSCYAGGEVFGDNAVGGLVGSNYTDFWTGTGRILRSYSKALVSGGENVGGLVGSYQSYDYGYNHVACFWDSDVNPDVNGIGNATDPNVVGLPTADMQTESTYTDAGWDFVGEVINGTEDIWKMNCEGMSYPKLSWWEAALGDFVCPDGVDMFDFGVLGEAWMSVPGDGHWDAGCDISEPNDNVIDGLDLEVFVGNWLEGM